MNLINKPRPPFPTTWDNSMREHFLECPRAWLFGSLLHLKPTQQSVHLHAGKAWAEGLEMARRAYYELGRDVETSEALGMQALIEAYGDFQAPHGSPKTLDRMMEALVYYYQCFPLRDDAVQPYAPPGGKPMIEFSFALPLDSGLKHPETEEPIIYTGRADMIATYAGAVSIYDDKTTSALGASWANQWLLRAQFSGYCWAARQYGIPATQVVIRGIAILKTQFNHAQVITHRSAHLVDQWHEQFIRDVKRAIATWKEGYYDANFSNSCASYGSCLFLQPCQSDNPAPWLVGGNYSRREWNPVTRTETPMELDDVQHFLK